MRLRDRWQLVSNWLAKPIWWLAAWLEMKNAVHRAKFNARTSRLSRSQTEKRNERQSRQ